MTLGKFRELTKDLTDESIIYIPGHGAAWDDFVRPYSLAITRWEEGDAWLELQDMRRSVKSAAEAELAQDFSYPSYPLTVGTKHECPGRDGDESFTTEWVYVDESAECPEREEDDIPYRDLRWEDDRKKWAKSQSLCPTCRAADEDDF